MQVCGSTMAGAEAPGAWHRNAPGVAPAWQGVLRLRWGNRAQLLLQGAALSGESPAG